MFVVGMHRAGTSALCAALRACGVSFGEHLIEPMSGVNDDGFWEATEVVALNERLLAISGYEWFSVTQRIGAVDWGSDEFAECRARASEVLARGFGGAAVEAVKDPRFCLTLPFWLRLCEQLGLRRSVCIVQRDPLEIAQSLAHRDAFPLGYGLRLQAVYLRVLQLSLPGDAHWLTYQGLLEDAPLELNTLLSALALSANEAALRSALRQDLRHQRTQPVSSGTATALAAPTDEAAYDAALERDYPVAETFADFAARLVARGRELTRIGQEHTRALATLDQRDADLSRLADEHTEALRTLDERDADLSRLAGEHTVALRTLDERDAQIGRLNDHNQTLRENQARLQRLFDIPLIGLLFRAVWKYATR